MKKPLTPLKAIRAHCRQCQGEDLRLVRECPTISCACYPYRMGKIPTGASGRLLPVIHAHCLNCAGTAQEVRTCSAPPEVETDGYPPCHLHQYRFGRRPNVSETARERGRIQAKINFGKPDPDQGSGGAPAAPPLAENHLSAAKITSGAGPRAEQLAPD